MTKELGEFVTARVERLVAGGALDADQELVHVGLDRASRRLHAGLALAAIGRHRDEGQAMVLEAVDGMLLATMRAVLRGGLVAIRHDTKGGGDGEGKDVAGAGSGLRGPAGEGRRPGGDAGAAGA